MSSTKTTDNSEMNEETKEKKRIIDLEQRIIEYQQKLQQAKDDRTVLESEIHSLKKEMQLSTRLRFKPKIAPPFQIYRNRPITVIANERFNMHVCRSREGIEEWAEQDYNYSEDFNNDQVMQQWSEYRWDCKLLAIPSEQQIQIEFKKISEDKYQIQFKLSLNSKLRTYGHAISSPELSYQPKSGK